MTQEEIAQKVVTQLTKSDPVYNWIAAPTSNDGQLIVNHKIEAMANRINELSIILNKREIIQLIIQTMDTYHQVKFNNKFDNFINQEGK